MNRADHRGHAVRDGAQDHHTPDACLPPGLPHLDPPILLEASSDAFERELMRLAAAHPQLKALHLSQLARTLGISWVRVIGDRAFPERTCRLVRAGLERGIPELLLIIELNLTHEELALIRWDLERTRELPPQ